MIEKLHNHPVYTEDGRGITGIIVPSSSEIVDKLNEIIDVVNSFEVISDNDSTSGDTIVPVKFIDLCNNCSHMGVQYCKDSHCEVESFCILAGEKRKLCSPDICPLIYRRSEVKE